MYKTHPMTKFNIYTVAALLPILSLIANSSFAEVRFDLRFINGQKNEFNRNENEWMKKAVIEAATDLGRFIKQDAFVTIQVYSDPSCLYAEAQVRAVAVGSDRNRYTAKVMDRILNNQFIGIQVGIARLWLRFLDLYTGELGDSPSWEGSIRFNTHQFSDFKRLKQVAMHELTHKLGFISFTIRDSRFDETYSDYDRLIVDKDGNPLLISSNENGDLKANPRFNHRGEIFSCGENSKKRNNGNCVKLYNPPAYVPGGSVIHLDSGAYPKNIMTHNGGNYIAWNKYEIGILEDLGYEIDWTNYCKFILNELPNNDFPQECFKRPPTQPEL